MNRGLTIVAVAALLTVAAFAQKQTKPWKEWNKKEAEKILNDSAWSHAQTESATSQSSEVPTNFGDTRGREDSVRTTATSASVTFHVRFFSARPVRQAYVRMLELAESAPDAARLDNAGGVPTHSCRMGRVTRSDACPSWSRNPSRWRNWWVSQELDPPETELL